tara:strand:- start:174 stop:413 length:240 start_codon:yes stop_codon:yes gene_type:complete
MKEFMIVIIMFFADPSYSGNDAFEITQRYGKPLVFKNIDECNENIFENLEELKHVGKTIYPTAIAVKEIFCLRRESTKI